MRSQTDGAGRGRRRGRVMVKVLVAGLVVAVGGLGIYALAVPGSGSGEANAPIDLARATVMTFEITTTATGDLQARNQIELRSELDTDTTIVDLVPEGTAVQKGDLILKLNGDQLKTQIDEESLRVESAKAELVAAENAFEIQKSENDSKERQAKLKLDLAQLALEQWVKGEVVQKNKDIELALAKADRDLGRLREKHGQNEKLLSEGFLSKDEYEQDYIRLLEADAAMQKARLEDETYRTYQHPKDKKSKESDVEEAAAELARVQQENEIQLTIKNAARLNQRRQLSIREERLATLQKHYAACTMLAPSAGLVVYASSAGRGWGGDDQPFQVGRRVMPRESLIVLPDTSEMVAVVKVHESLAGRIDKGLEAVIKIDMLGGQTFLGRVDSRGVMAETSDRWRDPNRREYSVRILLDHAGQMNLRPSMRCEAVITLGRVEDALSVPLQAVFAEEQLRFVFVPRGSKFARVPVKVGRRSDAYAEIVTGLEPGTQVLLRQPAQGEIMETPWSPDALKLVGFQLNDGGKPVPVAGQERAEGARPGGENAGPGPDRARGDGQRPRGRRPDGERAQRGQEQPKPAEDKKDAKDAATTGGGTDTGSTESTDTAAPAQAPGPRPGGG
jgi:HlyD family secretion protein